MLVATIYICSPVLFSSSGTEGDCFDWSEVDILINGKTVLNKWRCVVGGDREVDNARNEVMGGAAK